MSFDDRAVSQGKNTARQSKGMSVSCPTAGGEKGSNPLTSEAEPDQ